MAKKKKALTYESAYSELEEILEALQEGEVKLDDLTGKVERASELIKFCKDKLRSTQKSVGELFDDDEA